MNHRARRRETPQLMQRPGVGAAMGHAPSVLRALYWRMLLGAAWCAATGVALLARG